MSQRIARRGSTRLAAIAATAALSLGVGVGAGPALAQPQQNGLVNVNLSDNNIAVPVNVAANICGVSVDVLAADLGPDGIASCTADIDGTVTQRRRG